MSARSTPWQARCARSAPARAPATASAVLAGGMRRLRGGVDTGQRPDLLHGSGQIGPGYQGHVVPGRRPAPAASAVRAQNVADGARATGPACSAAQGTPSRPRAGMIDHFLTRAHRKRGEEQPGQPAQPQVGAGPGGFMRGRLAGLGEPAQREQQGPELFPDRPQRPERRDLAAPRPDDDRHQVLAEPPVGDERPPVQPVAQRADGDRCLRGARRGAAPPGGMPDALFEDGLLGGGPLGARGRRLPGAVPRSGLHRTQGGEVRADPAERRRFDGQ